MSDLMVIDGLVVDENGEIVEWPEGAPGDGPERIGWLINLYRSAAEAAEAFDMAKRTYGFVIGKALGEAGVKSLDTQYGKASRVAAGETKVADPAKVAEAVAAELLTHDDAAALLIRAAKQLDAGEVEDWIAERAETVAEDARQTWKATTTAVLITRRRRAGYTRITPGAAKPPRIELRAAEEVSA